MPFRHKRFRLPLALIVLVFLYVAMSMVADKESNTTMKKRSEIESLDQDALKSAISDLGDSSNKWRARKVWFITVAGILALLGVAFEMMQDGDNDKKEIAQSRLSFLVSQQSDLTLTQLRLRLADANVRISEADARVKEAEAMIASAESASRDAVAKVTAAEARIAEANRAAAEANRIAESERLARVRLEDKVAWRSLNDEQQASLGEQLERFAGQLADCSFLMSNMEAFSFSSDIAAALRKGNWRVIPPSPFMITLRGIDRPTAESPIEKVSTGVAVWGTKDSRSTTAAIALVSELQKRGFDATYFRPPPEVPTTPTVSITVEHRPEGAQGEAKLRFK